MLMPVRSISTVLRFCLVGFLVSVLGHTAHAAGIDTNGSTDLPFSIGGTQILDMTSSGLTVLRGGVTVNSAPVTLTNGRLSSTNTQTDWAAVFTGNTYGVYSHAPGWAGYFDGPVMITGLTTLNASATINGTTTLNGAVQINSVGATSNAMNTAAGNVGTQSGLVFATQYQSNWTGYFYGSGGYGVYGRGANWAGYFDGPVNVNGSETINGNANVNGYICLNGDCRTIWPSSTNTTITQVQPGITASCPSGQAMYALSNGQPVCMTVSTKTLPQLYVCPQINLCCSDENSGCVGQITTSSYCWTTTSNNHGVNSSKNACSPM